MKVSRPELSFHDRVAGIWGGLDETVRTADDPEVAMADFFQVTLQQLEAWRAAEGRQRCPGLTTRGHGCRNFVSTLIDYDPRLWVSRDPGFCPNHMKPQHEVAAARKIAPRNTSAEDDAGVTAR